MALRFKLPKRRSSAPTPASESRTGMLASDVSTTEADLGLEMSGSSSSGLETEPSADDAGGTGGRSSLSAILAQARTLAAWSTFLSIVFTVFAWVNLPTKAIAWRISQEAKAQGFILEVEDVTVTPWGSVTLKDVGWHFATKRPEEIPVPFIAERVHMRVAPVRYLLGQLHVSLDAEIDTGTLEMEFSKGEGGSELNLDLNDVPLYALPKVQQSLNAPIRGDLTLHVSLASPDETFAKASGEIEIDCRSCTVGDGETKLYVPSAKGMLANGMTIPEIDFGSINGKIVIEEGAGTAEEILSKSEDVTVKLYGDVRLGEPISKSDLNMRIKLFISEKMQQDNADIGLMVATASAKTKLEGEDAGGLGYRLMGTFGRPKLRTFKYKSAQERRDERAAKTKAKAKAKPKGTSSSRSDRARPTSRAATRERLPKSETPAARGKEATDKIDRTRATKPAETRDADPPAEAAEAFLGAKGLPSRIEPVGEKAEPAAPADGATPVDEDGGKPDEDDEANEASTDEDDEESDETSGGTTADDAEDDE